VRAFVYPAARTPFGRFTAVSTTLGWRLVNPRMPREWTVSLSECNEQLRENYGVSRQRQDAFAARSHRLAHAAWEEGFYDDLVVAVAHPLGASGGRILGTLAKVRQERGERYGVAAICIGVGQGLAVVLEITEIVLGGAAR